MFARQAIVAVLGALLLASVVQDASAATSRSLQTLGDKEWKHGHKNPGSPPPDARYNSLAKAPEGFAPPLQECKGPVKNKCCNREADEKGICIVNPCGSSTACRDIIYQKGMDRPLNWHSEADACMCKGM